MSVEDVNVGELQAFERCFRAFNQVFTRNAKVVDLVTGSWQVRVVGTPVDLRIMSTYAIHRFCVVRLTLVETTMSLLFQPKCLMARPMTFSDSPFA
jgi:hypothetical protein